MAGAWHSWFPGKAARGYGFVHWTPSNRILLPALRGPTAFHSGLSTAALSCFGRGASLRRLTLQADLRRLSATCRSVSSEASGPAITESFSEAQPAAYFRLARGAAWPRC